MLTTLLKSESIAAAHAAIPEGAPFVMLNLVKYKNQADYGAGSQFPPCTGREAYYQRYVPAFAKIAAALGKEKTFRPMFLASVLSCLVGPADEAWDDMVLVEYENFTAFRTVVESPEYERSAAPHREAALENWRFLALLKQPLP